MVRTLPPLNALRVFVSAANHGSFAKAASELNVTQSAVSKQIKLLEEYLGVPLFERKHQRVALTKAGKTYLSAMSKIMDAIEQATDKIIAVPDEKDVLHINILPTLSNMWLIPMIDEFKKTYGYNVSIEVGIGPIDFDKINADVAIRVGQWNKWKKSHTEIIMGEDLLPVCAPSVIRKHPIKTPKDFLQQNLLKQTIRPQMWEEYLSAIGCKYTKIEYVMGCEHFFMLMKAAQDGMGIALIPRFLIEKELQEGSLVVAFEADFKSDWLYYLVYPKPKAKLKKVKDFRKWILGKCKA